MSSSRVVAADTRDAVRVDGYAVDRTPVTNERYSLFVAATGHRTPAYWPDGVCPGSLAHHPVVGVDYFDAVAFARWANGRLPTELEWVLAAGVEEHRAYAWGDEFQGSRCNTIRSGFKGTTPVDAYPEGAAPSGCLDLCGNVWELTASAEQGHANTIVVKGGSWYDYPAHAKLDSSFHAPIHRVGRTVGFRLIYGGDECHPAFIDSALIDACIAYRAAKEACEVDAAVEEFDFCALRGELESEHGAGLIAVARPDEIAEGEAGAVDSALEWFDRAEQSEPATSASDNGKDIEQALDVALEWYMRMHAFVAKRPGILLVAAATAILLVATTLWASVSDPDRTRQSSGTTRIGTNDGTPRFAPATPAPRRTATADPAEAARRSVVDLTQGSPSERALALRVLLARGESSRASLEARLATVTDPDAELRLRYALAALDERKEEAGRSIPVTVLPSRGLVLVCEQFGSAERRCLEELRLFGRASRRDVHVVLSGAPNFGAWLEEHVTELGAVYVAWDPERNFALQHKLRGGTAVVGMRSDGRAAFVLPGTPSENRIFDQLRALDE